MLKFSRILFRKNLMPKKLRLVKIPFNTFCKKKDNDKDDIFDELINISKNKNIKKKKIDNSISEKNEEIFSKLDKEKKYTEKTKENKKKEKKNNLIEDIFELAKKHQRNFKKEDQKKNKDDIFEIFNKFKDLNNKIKKDVENNSKNKNDDKKDVDKNNNEEFFDFQSFLNSFFGKDNNSNIDHKKNDEKREDINKDLKKKKQEIKKTISEFENLFNIFFKQDDDKKNDQNKINKMDNIIKDKNKNPDLENFKKDPLKDEKKENKFSFFENLKNDINTILKEKKNSKKISSNQIDDIFDNIFNDDKKDLSNNKNIINKVSNNINEKNNKSENKIKEKIFQNSKKKLNKEEEISENVEKKNSQKDILKNAQKRISEQETQKSEEKKKLEEEKIKNSRKKALKKKIIKKEEINIIEVYNKIKEDINQSSKIQIFDLKKVFIYHNLEIGKKMEELDDDDVFELDFDIDFISRIFELLILINKNNLFFPFIEKFLLSNLEFLIDFENKITKMMNIPEKKNLKKEHDKNNGNKKIEIEEMIKNLYKDVKKDVKIDVKKGVKKDFKKDVNHFKIKQNSKKKDNLEKQILIFLNRVKLFEKKKLLELKIDSKSFLKELDKNPKLLTDKKRLYSFFKDTLFFIDKNIEKKMKLINFFKKKMKNEKNIYLKYNYTKYIITLSLNRIDLENYTTDISNLLIKLKKTNKEIQIEKIQKIFSENDFLKKYAKFLPHILLFIIFGIIFNLDNYFINKEVFNLKLINSEVKKINIIKINDEYKVIGQEFTLKTKDIEELFTEIDTIEKKSNKKNLNFNYLQTTEQENLLVKYGSTLVFIGFIYLLKKNLWKSIEKMNKSQQSKEYKNKTGVAFKDVAGLQEVKEEMMEFVEFLKDPTKFKKLGATMPKGALLTGPPGTGKTFLAKAVSGEAKVPFFYISGSEFVEKFVGVGASRVRELFKEAKKKSPSIIFIDEIDAIGKKRDNNSGNDETENTLNQLLVEMDGFGTNSDVVVMASTNLKDSLDNALLRPGRFDRIIEVNLPNLIEREEIFKIYLVKVNLDEKYNIDYFSKRLATLTPGFSGADICNICNEAAIIAVRNKNEKIQELDFEEAIEKVIGGIERKSEVFEEQKETVSVHESGHAVVSWFLEGGNPLLKLTIKPRSKGALGFAQYLPPESNLYKKSQLKDQIASILGGRVAEMVFFGKSSTGAYDDFQKAKKIAFEMVTSYGMSERLNFVRFSFDQNGNREFSEKTHGIIDQEVDRIIGEETERCFRIVREKKDFVKKLSEKLLEKEVLIFSDIVKILGDRPFKANENFRRFLEEAKKINGDKETAI